MTSGHVARLEPDSSRWTSLRARVSRAVESAKVFDLHTHLFPPEFGALCLSGVDELLTYHYLIAETLRFTRQEPEQFLALSKRQQADTIWTTLFVERTPLSEAASGVAATLVAMGLDPAAKDLREARSYSQRPIQERMDWVFSQAGIEAVTMTNDPLNADEGPVYHKGFKPSDRFKTALRIDPILFQGDGGSVAIQEYVKTWATHLAASYVAASLPPDLDLAGDSDVALRLRGAVLPTLESEGLPLALMIGVRRRINPRLDMAGDGVGLSDLSGLAELLRQFPKVRFLVTTLARENSQELCVLARKFANLIPFGCWWFQNTPSLVRETTTMRLELLGASFVPQHSDARILEQLVYKWSHSRKAIAQALSDRYVAMGVEGVHVTDAQIAGDVEALMRTNALEAMR